ncbi:hypothetical protein G4B88_000670 [Cannabis sativa]|uniref:Gamma-glutamylcyclotransferase family protein n=1 Tax=Cannabis sativa TaxID=3483 RepID=A0A7J6HHX3_CANSA|nr:hypothetical protein G4B88_000670 [Cannabis sativa]
MKPLSPNLFSLPSFGSLSLYPIPSQRQARVGSDFVVGVVGCSSGGRVWFGNFFTYQPIPLVIRIYGIPYLINLPRSGQRIKGELYSVTAFGLARLDNLKGFTVCHYERLSIQVVPDLKDNKEDDVVLAEADFAHRSFGDELKGEDMCRERIE